MRDSVLIYRSFAEAIEQLSNEDAGRIYKAITKYAMDGTQPDLDGMLLGYFTLIKPQIDANNQRYANGIKGGRPPLKKPNDNQSKTKAKPNDNRTETEPKPKEKEKEKVKVKVKDKDNVSDMTKRVRFAPPTEQQLLEYCIEAKLDIDTSAFIDFYSSKGWKVGSQSMKDWKAAARNWARRDRDKKPKSNLGLFGDYKQTSKDEEWDDFSRLASGGKS